MSNVSTIKLDDANNYAIIAPGQITYALKADEKYLEKVIKEVEKQVKNYKISSEDNDRVSLSLMPTYDCNLRCIYCYANGGKDKDILSESIAKKALNYVRNYNKAAKYLDLYLVGGGEPLLHFDLIKKIISYADTLFDHVEINVVSNGTFSKEVCDWLIIRKANVRISYDVLGQDIQRKYENNKSSKKDVINNIKRLIENNINVLIQCIITSYTVDKMKDIVDELLELKISAVKFEPCLMTDVSRGTISLQPNPIAFADSLLEVIEYIANNNFPILIDTGYFTKPTLGKYCGLGNGNFTVTPQGKITSCVEVSRSSDPYSDIIIFGKIEENVEIDNKKLDFLESINYKNQHGGCSKCPYRLICLGGCPMANIWQNGLPLTKSKFTCQVEHAFLPRLLLKLIENDKIINVIMENPEKVEI